MMYNGVFLCIFFALHTCNLDIFILISCIKLKYLIKMEKCETYYMVLAQPNYRACVEKVELDNFANREEAQKWAIENGWLPQSPYYQYSGLFSSERYGGYYALMSENEIENDLAEAEKDNEYYENL